MRRDLHFKPKTPMMVGEQMLEKIEAAYRQTDRQTDRQTHIQTDAQTDRQTHTQTHKQIHRQTDAQTDTQGCDMTYTSSPRPR